MIIHMAVVDSHNLDNTMMQGVAHSNRMNTTTFLCKCGKIGTKNMSCTELWQQPAMTRAANSAEESKSKSAASPIEQVVSAFQMLWVKCSDTASWTRRERYCSQSNNSRWWQRDGIQYLRSVIFKHRDRMIIGLCEKSVEVVQWFWSYIFIVCMTIW